MDWNRVEGDWKRMKGKVKEQWGRLTDDDLTAIDGRRDQLEGKLQERYGYAKDQVRKEIDDWYRSTAWDLRGNHRNATVATSGDAEELADHIEAIRAEIQSLTSAVSRIANKRLGRAQDKALEAANDAGEAIRQNPVSAVAIALGLGFLFGVFTRR
jgi:uncharacterized protein YjbJ (UPF0337 family)/ElaB/YqjD/DUF883 family membrane-anchored ribosome-binding protein